MAISTLHWNVRNMTNKKLGRPGEKGNGLSTKERADAFVEEVNKHKPDFVVFIETRDDAKTIFNTALATLLAAPNTYDVAISGIVSKGDDEVYTMLAKNTFPGIGMWDSQLLPNNSSSGLRKAATFEITTVSKKKQGKKVKKAKVKSFGIVALHATFTTTKAKREEFVKEILKELNPPSGAIPLLFLGDFNFKRTEVDDFIQSVKGEKFSWLGPKDSASDPDATSVRKWKTILRTGDFFSQPYDISFSNIGQWKKAGEAQKITVTVADKLQQNLETLLVKVLTNNARVNPFRTAFLTDTVEDLLSEIKEKKKLFDDLTLLKDDLEKKVNQLVTGNPLKKPLHDLSKSLDSINKVFISSFDKTWKVVENLNDFSPINQQNMLANMHPRVIAYVINYELILGFIRGRLGQAPPGGTIISINEAAFSAFVSDHLPVLTKNIEK